MQISPILKHIHWRCDVFRNWVKENATTSDNIVDFEAKDLYAVKLGTFIDEKKMRKHDWSNV
jgi:hypothetical protein